MNETNNVPEEENIEVTIEETKEQDNSVLENSSASEPVADISAPKAPKPKLPFIIGGIVAGVVAIAVAVALVLGGGNSNQNVDNSSPSDENGGSNLGGNGHEHSFGEWVVTAPVTCTTNGEKEQKCFCGDTKREPIVSTGHSYTSVVTLPTKNEDGYTTYTCSACDDSYIDNYVAATGSVGLAYTVKDNNCAITGIGSCSDADVIIPGSIDGKTVTAIAERAFADCANLSSINLPNTIKTIGTRAFYGCTGLIDFTVPASVTNIGAQIFYKAENLSTVYYNSNYGNESNQFLTLAHIKKVVFGGSRVPSYILNDCSNITEVTIADSVTSIGNFAFDGCSSLTNIVIPDSVISVGGFSFDGCSSLTSIVIPDSVTSIGSYAFYECSSLTSIVIPDSITSICDGAFSDCTSLESIVIPDSVTSIGSYAFYECTSLESVVIGDSVTSIGEGAFSRCTSLESVVMPNSVTSIGKRAFQYCTSLTSVVIPDSVTRIGNYAFYHCDSLTDVYYTGSEEEWSAISIYSYNDPIENATIHYNYVPEE